MAGRAGDVVERRGEGLRAEPPRARPDPLAAEAEAAIDGADRNQLDQHAVGIAMDEPLDRAPRVVADRVVGLGRIAPKLATVGNELAGDRVPGIVAVDQADEGGREPDGVALGDGLEFGEPPRRGETGVDEHLGVVRRGPGRLRAWPPVFGPASSAASSGRNVFTIVTGVAPRPPKPNDLIPVSIAGCASRGRPRTAWRTVPSDRFLPFPIGPGMCGEPQERSFVKR